MTQLVREGSPPPGLRRPQAKLSYESNQVARGRIRRFESSMPSQAVWSDRRHSEWRVVEVHPWAANEFKDAD
jgi:hypothetical protein